MKLSNKYILSTKSESNLIDPLIARISFDEQEKQISMITAKPVICPSCGAAITDMKSVKDDPVRGLHFICEFCKSLNNIDRDTFETFKSLQEDIIEIEYPQEKEKKKEFHNNIVACIDISASMIASSLNAVKSSLIETLKNLSVNSPDTGFALITFSDFIILYNSEGKEIVKISGDYLDQEDIIWSVFNQVNFQFEKIQSSYKKWISLISTLKVEHTTALGPAVLGAVALLKENGRILLLTDGTANLGVGLIERYDKTMVKTDFYNRLGDYCSRKGIIIEIIGVRTYMTATIGLDTIGEMAHMTGGDIYFVTANEIASSFYALSQSDIIAKNVKVRVFIHSSLMLNELSGEVLFHKKDKFFELEPGAMNPDRRFCCTLNLLEDLSVNQELPFQVQVEYTDLEGKKKIRIYNQKIFVTDKEEEIIENFASDVSDDFYTQKSAEFARKKTIDLAMEQLEIYGDQLEMYLKKASPEKQDSFTRSMTIINEALENMSDLQRREKNKDAIFDYYQKIICYGTTSTLRNDYRTSRLTRIAEDM